MKPLETVLTVIYISLLIAILAQIPIGVWVGIAILFIIGLILKK